MKNNPLYKMLISAQENIKQLEQRITKMETKFSGAENDKKPTNILSKPVAIQADNVFI